MTPTSTYTRPYIQPHPALHVHCYNPIVVVNVVQVVVVHDAVVVVAGNNFHDEKYLIF